MLRGHHAPTDFASIDRAKHLTKAEKLAVIEAAPVQAHRTLAGHNLRLPYVDGLYYVPISSFSALHVERINVGDEELYGEGIGSRLLKAAIRHGLEVEPTTSEISATWARLGFLNTIIKVLGEENVSVTQFGHDYGAGSEKPLEAMFDDAPFEEGKPYAVHSVVGQIDPEVAATWELPQPV